MKRKNGTDILKEINNMTQEQLIDYREKNRQFVEKVEKRKIKNIIRTFFISTSYFLDFFSFNSILLSKL